MESLNKVIEGSPEYEFHKPAPTTKEDKEHELAAWLNNLDLEGEEGEGEDFRGCANPKASPKGVELCRCTHCGNPSAVLRKCKCNKVRSVSDPSSPPPAPCADFGFPTTLILVSVVVLSKVLRYCVSEAGLEEAQAPLFSRLPFLISCPYSPSSTVAAFHPEG